TGVDPSGRMPLEYVNCAVGVSLASPSPADTYGDTWACAGTSYRTPPIEYQAGTRAVPMTLSPCDADSVAIVLSTAGRASEGCRLWNSPRLPNTSRCGATRTPASNSTLPDVLSVLAAKPPRPVTYPRSGCASDGAADNSDNAA